MSLTNSVLKGSFTLLIMRMFLRGVGLINMLILARLLSAEDFGLVALASSAVFLFDILSETGVTQYIIQKDKVDSDTLNTAWTLNLLLKLIVWLIFVISIPYISNYFETPKLNNALYIISLILPISGLMNPGMALHQKELNFTPLFRLAIIDKIISFTVVIVLAVYLKNYWAMVIGVLVSYITKVIISFYLHDFRPKFSLKRFSEQWSFSQWMLYKGFLGYVRAQFDTVMISKSFGLNILGGYDMMKGLSAMPAQDIIIPATQPLLSSFSKVKDDKVRLASQMRLSIFIICIAIFPISYFMALHHELIIKVVLGDKWVTYSPLLGIMSILLFTFSFVAVFQHALTALGKVKIIFYYDLFSVTTIISLLLFINYSDVQEFTLLRCLLAVLTLAIYSLILNKIFTLNLLHLLKITLPLIFTCFIAGLCSQALSGQLIALPWLSFFITPFTFFICYLLLNLILYSLMLHNDEVQQVKRLLLQGLTTLKNKLSTNHELMD